MKSLLLGFGLVAITLSTSVEKNFTNGLYPTSNLEQQLAGETVACVSDERVKSIAKQIRLKYKPEQRDLDTYVLEVVPQADNIAISKYAGQFTVYFVGESGLSIFDRTDKNSANWYNVSSSSNSESDKGCGCGDIGVYLTITKRLTQNESREKFNAAIFKIEKMLKYKN
ncbi:MAG: hypothetical protein ACP5N2_04170 [Candidatus Nanoarchaeia archaeon]